MQYLAIANFTKGTLKVEQEILLNLLFILNSISLGSDPCSPHKLTFRSGRTILPEEIV